MRHGCCPILCLFMHSVLKYFILVLILLWVICKGSNPCGRCSTGVLMGLGGGVGGHCGRAVPKSFTSSTFPDVSLPSFLQFLHLEHITNEFPISSAVISFHLESQPTLCALFTSQHTALNPASHPGGWFATTATTWAFFFFFLPYHRFWFLPSCAAF